ncbi:phage antirepressor KilAC domain-containing protein [Peribacillus simplex]|uniref:Prophage antirepressor n=1 Tax=Peribacillus simplex TaxID=1478 RepID=A0AAN2TRY8_9BACI|nr:phage antirepressor KilAC domain-containing protein [Peribacillus simplex]CEG31421.1 prophage antirepressor [Peribacillus simplex]
MKTISLVEERDLLNKKFRIYGDLNSPLFLAKEVAEWIEYSLDKVGQMIDGIDEDEKLTSPIHYSGQVRNMWFLTEDGLYEVLMQSQKPIAKQFKKEVKNILKTIRKTGGYISNTDLMVNTYFGALPSEQQIIIKSLFTNIEEQQKLITIMKPKTDYFDALVDRNLLTNIRETAKELQVKQKDLVSFLLENKYVFRDSKKKLKPYAQYVPELFEIKEWANDKNAGTQTLITPKGRETFRLLLNNKIS